jgi:biopolymer transport protein ExbB/TolQ
MTNELLMAIAASITAFGVLIGAIVAIYRIAKRISDALGLDRDGRSLSDRMERVEHQLWENGGSSLADRVNNIERHIVKVSTEIELIKDITLGLHSASQDSTSIVEPIHKPIRRKKA